MNIECKTTMQRTEKQPLVSFCLFTLTKLIKRMYTLCIKQNNSATEAGRNCF